MTPHQRSDSESTSERTLTRRTYVGVAGLATAAVSGLAGCLGDDGDETGTLATRVTDQPGDIADFESCVVTIQGIWVRPGEAATDDGTTEDTADTTVGNAEDDGREYYQLDEPQEADLVDLQDGNTKLLGERELPVDTYAFLQLDVTGVEAVLDDGSDAAVTTPGEAPLKFEESFEIRADQTTTFTADFTPVKRGQTDAYVLRPVASGTEVSYE